MTRLDATGGSLACPADTVRDDWVLGGWASAGEKNMTALAANAGTNPLSLVCILRIPLPVEAGAGRKTFRTSSQSSDRLAVTAR